MFSLISYNSSVFLSLSVNSFISVELFFIWVKLFMRIITTTNVKDWRITQIIIVIDFK